RGGDLRLEPGEFLLERPAGLEHLLELAGELDDGHLEHAGGAGEHRLLGLDALERDIAGDGLDSADAGRDAALGDDAEQANVAGAAHVRPAAELTRAADVEDPDLVAVLLAEQRHRAAANRLVVGDQPGLDRSVLEDLAIDDLLDLANLLAGHRRVVAEVEARLLRIHQRALLLDMRAEHLAQRLVHQVRRRVVAHGAGARRAVHARMDGVADRDLAGDDFAVMSEDVGLDLLGVVDPEQRQAGTALGDLAAVADLAARFG